MAFFSNKAKKARVGTTPGLPGRSPIPVLFWPMGAYLRSSDGIRSSSPGMIVPRTSPSLERTRNQTLRDATAPPTCRKNDTPKVAPLDPRGRPSECVPPAYPLRRAKRVVGAKGGLFLATCEANIISRQGCLPLAFWALEVVSGLRRHYRRESVCFTLGVGVLLI